MIVQLKSQFARQGIPATLISDGGPQFTSAEFETLTSTCGIHHQRSSPYSPQSNGLAENGVNIVKRRYSAKQRSEEKVRTSPCWRTGQHRWTAGCHQPSCSSGADCAHVYHIRSRRTLTVSSCCKAARSSSAEVDGACDGWGPQRAAIVHCWGRGRSRFEAQQAALAGYTGSVPARTTITAGQPGGRGSRASIDHSTTRRGGRGTCSGDPATPNRPGGRVTRACVRNTGKTTFGEGPKGSDPIRLVTTRRPMTWTRVY